MALRLNSSWKSAGKTQDSNAQFIMNNHIILTSGRSGSNYLANVLNLHPQIVNYGEVLASMIVPYKLYAKCKICPWQIEQYLDAFYQSRILFYTGQCYSAYAHWKADKPTNFKTYRNVTNIGTKDFFLNVRAKQVEDYYLSRPEIAIIYLHRGNLLKRYLSGVFLKKTRVAATEEKPLAVEKVIIDLSQMKKSLAAMEQEIANEQRILVALDQHRHRLFPIKYEDYFSSEESITDYNQRLFEFLGVKPIAIKSQHKKILPQAMPDLIENYDEFSNSLRHTQYEQYLEQI